MRAALARDPRSAAAAYNLAVVVARDRPDEGVTLSRRASELEPASAKYAYTWAFYLAQRGDRRTAISVLGRALDGGAVSTESYTLLGRLLTQAGRTTEAQALFRRAASDARLPAAGRAGFAAAAPPRPAVGN